MSGPLQGKVAWITGASSGIGQACARLLADDGATVVLSAREPANLARAAGGMTGGAVHALPVDVTDGSAVEAAARRIEADFGGIDILVNSAGLNIARRAWADVEPADWQRVFEVNVSGTYHCIRAALPAMRARGGGLVVNIASWAGRFPSGKAGPAYNAAKSAVIALTQTLNMEEHRHGIRACAVSPGETATPIMARRAVPPTQEELARMLQPEDVAAVVRMVACMPPRACVNEVVITPTANHAWR
jgi:NAD(P)-dependent dehydrogenase (short-subunit alcohol dehydrogenase family)